MNKQNVEDILDLSLIQKGMLFHYLQDNDSTQYNIQIVLQVEGKLELDLFDKALQRLQATNEVLRSVFSWEKTSKPVQIILKEMPLKVDYVDYSEREVRVDYLVKEHLENDKKKRFDLKQAPLRITVLKVGDEKNLVCFTHHHILYDGWSTGIIFKELFSNYDAILNQSDLQPFNKPSYQQLIASLNDDKVERTSFWKGYLQGYDIVSLYQKKTGDTKEGISSLDKMSALIDIDLAGFCQKYKVTGASTIYAAYGILLQKYLFTNDIVFGTAVSYKNSSLTNGNEVVGNFVTSLPLRLAHIDGKSLSDIVRQVHSNLINRSQYNASSYYEIKNAIGLDSGLDLFDSAIMIENYPLDQSFAKSDTGLDIELYSVYENLGFPLYFSVYFEELLKIELTFEINKFQIEYINSLLGHFTKILQEIVSHPDLLISELDILNTNHRNRSFNFSAVKEKELLLDESVYSLFVKQAQKTPDQTALYNNEEEITYSQLLKRVENVAASLIDHGVRRNEIVGIFLERSIDYVVSILAVLRNKAVYLPLDTANPLERIGYMLKACKAATVIVREADMRKLGAFRGISSVCIDEVINNSEYISGWEDSYVSENINVIFTSGSTGLPKGVLGSQKALLNRLHWGWEAFPYQKDEKVCFKTNIGFVDHVGEVFSPLLAGVPVRLFKDSEVVNIPYLYSAIISEKITRITLVPTLLRAIIEHKDKKYHNTHSLKYVFSSGEYLSYNLAKNFYQEFSGATLVNIYGSTEVTADVTYHVVNRYQVEDILKYFKDYSFVDDSSQNDRHHDFPSGYITQPDVQVGELAHNFRNTNISEYPVDIDEYYAFFNEKVLPYCVNTSSTKFIGHMTSVLPDYVHDISKLVSKLNQNLVKIETAKSMTFIEREAIAILHKIFFSFPEDFYNTHIQKLNSNIGIITSGGSTANISAMLSARNKALYGDNKEKLSGSSIHQVLKASGYEDMVIIGSGLMHYSFNKAASLLGLGKKNILHIKNDSRGRADLTDLNNKISYCCENRLLIIAVVGIAGATETGSIDPLKEIGQVCRKNNIHFHVDAAWGGLLKFSDQYKMLLDGIEMADSITFCGHKQLFLPQGISVCLFRDPHQLNYNSTEANYQAKYNSYDFGRVTLEGSRPGLSLSLHASLHILGRKGYGLLLEKGIDLARSFIQIISENHCFHLVSSNINIVNYRYIPENLRYVVSSTYTEEDIAYINDVNTKIQEHQFLKGRTFVSKTKVKNEQGDYIVVFRVVLSNPLATKKDLESVVQDQLVIIEELFGEKNQFRIPEAIVESPASENVREDVSSIPIGKPIHNTRIVLLDRYDKPQAYGNVGEICVSGDCLAIGYVNGQTLPLIDMTTPEGESKQFFKTGDLGKFLSDGSLEFHGRFDNQVKISGQRIELGEIESILNDHDEIIQSVVSVAGKGNSKKLLAYYRSNGPIDEGVLREYLMQRVPHYMIPLKFIWLQHIPLLVSGKIDRRSLPVPTFNSVVDYVSAENDIQRKLVKIWMELLNREEDHFGIKTGFFSIGGDSFKSISLANKIFNEFDVKISLKDIFQRPTIQRLSEFIEAKTFVNSTSDVSTKSEKVKVII